MCYTAPNGEHHRIEFLGSGQQAIFYGYHNGAKQDYQWHAGRDPLKVPPREWPAITEIDADELLVGIDELLTEQFGYTRTTVPGADGRFASAVHVANVDNALAALDYKGVGGSGNVHDTELGCINAIIVKGGSTESAIEEVLTAVRLYAACNPLCARWDWEKERLRLEKMAFSFVNKFSDYADRLPPDLYAMRQVRRGQGRTRPLNLNTTGCSGFGTTRKLRRGRDPWRSTWRPSRGRARPGRSSPPLSAHTLRPSASGH